MRTTTDTEWSVCLIRIEHEIADGTDTFFNGIEDTERKWRTHDKENEKYFSRKRSE